jgi:hypothetical protein
MRRRQAARVVGPGLGQVERAVNEGVPVPRRIGGEDPDLAVGDLARRAGVLPPDAARCLALLEKAGLINDQHRIRVSQRLQRVVAHDVAQRICLPAAAAKDGLLPPRPGIARRLGPHPARLAPLRPEQPIEELASRCRHPVLGEQGTDPCLGLPQRRRPQFQRRLDRCTAHQLTPGQRGATRQPRKSAAVVLERDAFRLNRIWFELNRLRDESCGSGDE